MVSKKKMENERRYQTLIFKIALSEHNFFEILKIGKNNNKQIYFQDIGRQFLSFKKGIYMKEHCLTESVSDFK